MAIVAIPILPVKTISGNQFAGRRIIERQSQTFKLGVVVSLNADGGVQIWDVSTLSGAQGSPIGISQESASSLSATGTGAPSSPFGSLGQGATITFGNVQNEPSAVNIPHGAPINDGRVGLFLATLDTVFSATFGNAGSPAAPAATDVGATYGLTLDTAGNFFYVDKSKSNSVKVVGLDPRDAVALQTSPSIPAGSRVLFQFLSTVVQQLA